MGDLNDDRKEGTKGRTLARNMGGSPFRIRTLANVRAEMRNGNARILTGPCHVSSAVGMTRSFPAQQCVVSDYYLFADAGLGFGEQTGKIASLEKFARGSDSIGDFRDTIHCQRDNPAIPEMLPQLFVVHS